MLAGFAATDFLTPSRCASLRNHFGSLTSAWRATDPQDFIKAGFSAKSSNSFCEKKRVIEPEKVLSAIEASGARIVFYEDDDYPLHLKTIDSPPAILLVRGTLAATDHFSLSVVGTRRISSTGKRMAESLIPDLVKSGLAIISGLALGVDAVAHQTTLTCGGKTIAVLGNGIDEVYPTANRTLAEKIIANNGAIISEFCPGVQPLAYNFPRRNRIVAGMSFGTLVIEGAEKSGSLITAQFALAQGREVFAVPGSPISPLSSGGPNRLIQRGEAKLVITAEDILQELPLAKQSTLQQTPFFAPHDPVEKDVFDLLDSEPRLFDEIVRDSSMSPAQFSATLTILEMKGFAVNFGGNRWAKKLTG